MISELPFPPNLTFIMIKCTLFSKNIGFTAREFSDGELQAIVLADAKTISALMESNDNYYYNNPKVAMAKEMFKKGHFEIPLVAPRGESLHWIEGFHQVNAALESGASVVPIGTSLALAQRLKSLIVKSEYELAPHQYDFSECEATVV